MQEIPDNLHIKNREDLLSKIIENAPIGILIFSHDWTIEFINENFIEYGIVHQFDTSSLLTNKNLFEINIFSDPSIKNELLELENGYSFEKEIRNIKTIDNNEISVIVKGTPFYDNEFFNGGILIVEDLKIFKNARNDVQLSTSHLEKVINRVNDFLFITNDSGKVIHSLGKKIKNLNEATDISTGFDISQVFSPSARDLFNKHLDIVKLKRRSDKLDLELKINQEKFLYECRIEPLLDKRGQIQFIFFFLNDLTKIFADNKKLLKEVDELSQYQLIAEAVTDAAFTVDLEGKIQFWNKDAEILFEFNRSQVFGKFFGRVLGLFDIEYFNKIKEELNKNKIWKSQLTVFKKNEQKEIIEAKLTLSGENEDTIVVLCTNITERAVIEKQLRISEEKFRNIITQADEFICTLDTDGTITYVNPKFTTSLKYSEDELINKNIKDIIDPKFLEKNDFNLRSFDIGKKQNMELPVKTKYGDIVYLLANFSPIFFDNNTIRYFNGIFTDITDKKAAEKDLMIFQSIVDASQDGIAVESEGKITLVNDSFANMFGYSSNDSLVGNDLLDLVDKKDVVKVSDYFRQLNLNENVPNRYVFIGKKRDNTQFLTEISVSSFKTNNKLYNVMITRDVTERKRAQEAIKQSEEKYRNITENIDDFLYTQERIGKTLRPIFYTSSVEKITGYTQTDFLSDSKLFLKIIYPDDFQHVKKKLRNLFRSRILLSDEVEFRIINKYGNIVWIRNKVNLVRSREGIVQKIYGLVSDISLRKKAEEELKISTQNLVKLNETKDRFISIISHDLRTPFSSILGFTDLLLSDDDLTEEEKRQYVQFIQSSSKSMLALVNSLLDWTRLQTGRISFEPARFQANSIVENSINTLSGVAFQKNIALSSDVADDVYVFVDQNLLEQVFNNLISNAIKFTRKGGYVTVTASPSDKIRFYQFSVKDNGTGIKPENINKLFNVDTKFTSEGTSGEKGTGLGLSLVKEIIEKHGGKIWVESQYEKGTEFIFTLPIASANILLVDDNKTDRLLYSKILKNITPDYNIDLASNGKEAFEKILKSPPALVITDHIMPNMNGFELIQEINKADIKGKPPVIILSSEIDRNTISDYNAIGIEYVFQKPVNLSNFKLAVEKSLRKGPTIN